MSVVVLVHFLGKRIQVIIETLLVGTVRNVVLLAEQIQGQLVESGQEVLSLGWQLGFGDQLVDVGNIILVRL
jgi:hypothetical protein